MDSIHFTGDKTKGETVHVTNAELLDMKNRLDEELQGLLIAQSAASQESGPGDLEDLQRRVHDLQEQLLTESNTRSINELFLKRIQTGKTLCDSIFSDDSNPEDNLHIKRSLEELELATEIKRIQKETLELQEKLENQKLTNLQLQKDNTEMMLRLQQSREQAQALSAQATHNKDYKRLKSELEVKTMSLDIHKHLIQLLILGTGQDWRLKSEFEKVMLECGESLNL